MELLIEIVTYIIAAILIGIIGAWIYLIKSMIESFTKTPYLDKFENTNNLTPKVSIILPARNEEKYLAKCLDSLIEQDYENYEIVVIDDSSEDTTGKIIAEYAEKNSKIIHVSANSKPEGWMGKNWACMEGYRHAKGEILLFTDVGMLLFIQSNFLAEKKLSEDDHHHYQGAVRAGNYSCAAALDDFGLAYGSNVIEIILKVRADGATKSLGLSAGYKIGLIKNKTRILNII